MNSEPATFSSSSLPFSLFILVDDFASKPLFCVSHFFDHFSSFFSFKAPKLILVSTEKFIAKDKTETRRRLCERERERVRVIECERVREQRRVEISSEEKKKGGVTRIFFYLAQMLFNLSVFLSIDFPKVFRESKAEKSILSLFRPTKLLKRLGMIVRWTNTWISAVML